MTEGRHGLAASQPLARQDAGYSPGLAAARVPLTRGPLSSIQATEGAGLLSRLRGQGHPHYKGVGQAALQGFQQRRRDRAARASGGAAAPEADGSEPRPPSRIPLPQSQLAPEAAAQAAAAGRPQRVLPDPVQLAGAEGPQVLNRIAIAGPVQQPAASTGGPVVGAVAPDEGDVQGGYSDVEAAAGRQGPFNPLERPEPSSCSSFSFGPGVAAAQEQETPCARLRSAGACQTGPNPDANMEGCTDLGAGAGQGSALQIHPQYGGSEAGVWRLSGASLPMWRATSPFEETEGPRASEAAGPGSAHASVSFGGWHVAAVKPQLQQGFALPQGGLNPLYDGPKPSAIPRPPSPAAGRPSAIPRPPSPVSRAPAPAQAAPVPDTDVASASSNNSCSTGSATSTAGFPGHQAASGQAGSSSSSSAQLGASQLHMAVHRLGLTAGDAVSGSRLPVGVGSLDSQEQEGLRAQDGQAPPGSSGESTSCSWTTVPVGMVAPAAAAAGAALVLENHAMREEREWLKNELKLISDRLGYLERQSRGIAGPAMGQARRGFQSRAPHKRSRSAPRGPRGGGPRRGPGSNAALTGGLAVGYPVGLFDSSSDGSRSQLPVGTPAGIQAAARPQARPAGRSNSASRARPAMHRRSGSLDAATAGGAQPLVSPLNLSGLSASGAQAVHGAGVRELSARAGRGSGAGGESSRRAPAASRRAENDENAGSNRLMAGVKKAGMPSLLPELPKPHQLQVERPVFGESNARHAAPLALMLQPAGARKLAVIPSPSFRDWQR